VLGAQNEDLASLANRSSDVIQQAQAGKLVGSGRGTFTVSNLGMFGIESFTAIINPPEGAILAVGGVHQELVPAGGGFLPRPMMRVTLSCDHRAIDGLIAARFLSRVRHILEAGRLLIRTTLSSARGPVEGGHPTRCPVSAGSYPINSPRDRALPDR